MRLYLPKIFNFSMAIGHLIINKLENPITHRIDKITNDLLLNSLPCVNNGRFQFFFGTVLFVIGLNSAQTMASLKRQYGVRQTIDLCCDWCQWTRPSSDDDQSGSGNEQIEFRTTLEGFQHRFATSIFLEKYESGLELGIIFEHIILYFVEVLFFCFYT